MCLRCDSFLPRLQSQVKRRVRNGQGGQIVGNVGHIHRKWKYDDECCRRHQIDGPLWFSLLLYSVVVAELSSKNNKR